MLASVWDQIQSPLLYALPVFAALIAVEAVMLSVERRRELRGVDHVVGSGSGTAMTVRKTGYNPVDTRTSLTMGAVALLFMVAFKALTLVMFVAISVYLAPWHIPTDTWWSWLLLFVAVDIAWYFNHRFSHRVRIGWAAHQAHHSSEYFNFGTALRQKWNPWSEAVFWIPLPLLGFEPWTIYVAFAFNLIYQFFTHTETVGTMWGPIEYMLNTPSHHRVHHGSDEEYLDKNYGGILIVWDRLFGTFQKELHRPRYGLTTPVDTYNVSALQYREYGKIATDVRHATRWRDRLGYVFAPPGWEPAQSPAVSAGREDTQFAAAVRTSAAGRHRQ